MPEGDQNAKYGLQIEQALGPVTGDNAQVVQHFYIAQPASPPAPREELLAAVRQAGAELRAYPDKIAGVHIPRAEVQQIVEWALNPDPQQRLGMLLDQPGMGKTVVLRDVLVELESAGVPALAIKADTLSSVRTRGDLADRLGLPAPVEECARHLATEGPFVVVLDQLDALSLALSRDQATLDVMTGTLARLRDVEGVRVIASCRTFDLNNDPRLSTIQVDHQFQLQPLTREQVNSVLQAMGIDPDRLLPAHREVITVPLHLDIYARVVEATQPNPTVESFRSLQDLYQALWQRRIEVIPPENPSPSDRVSAIYRLVEAMQAARQLTAPVGVLDELPEAASYLERVRFIRRESGNWLLFHQTFFDYCCARRLAAQGRSLSEEVLAGPQGLFERSQVVQTLAYLRGSDAAAYRRELSALLFASNPRVHLRLLLIGWLGSLADPNSDELGIARRLMTDVKDRARFLLAAQGSAGWFDLLNQAVLPSLLRSADAQLLDRVAAYLRSAIPYRTDPVLQCLGPYAGKDETWDARIALCLGGLDDWNHPSAVDMLCDLLRRGRTSHHESHCLYLMAHSNPAGGCRALRVYLNRLLDDWLTLERSERKATDAQNSVSAASYWRYNGGQRLLEEHSIGEIMEQAVAKCPEAVVEYLLPWFVRAALILARASSQGEYYPSDSVFAHGWHHDVQREGVVFARRMARSLGAVAKEQPEAFRVVASELIGVESHAVQRVLVQAYLADPQAYADDIFTYLTADRRRLRIGDDDGYDSQCLYGAVFPHLDPSRRRALEQLVLSHVPGWEKRSPRDRGITQLGFLKSVSPDLLGAPARRQLRELEHKFTDYVWQPPEGPQGGWVGPPIDPSSQERMSDDDWLNAMRRYDDSGYEHPDLLKGGIRQLSSSFQEQVKSASERFYHLAKERFDDSISLHYINAAIAGLADSDAPAERVYDLVRQFAPRIEGEFRRYVCWSLQKRAKCGVPDDLLDRMADWALHDPDPSPELGESSPDGDPPYREADPYEHGINTNRGAALRATCQCAMQRELPQVERTFRLLDQAASDASTVVRACVVEGLGPLLEHDSECALAIFVRAMDGHPRLLQCDWVARFLHWTYYHHFSRVRPFIEALLAYPDDAARQAGARLACLAAFRYPEADELAKRAWDGDAVLRRGAAQVYAHNLEQPNLEDTCCQHLLRLMHDADPQVRANVCACFDHLRPEHLDRLRPFIDAFLNSPALLDGTRHFLNYLVPLAGDEYQLALAATERILDRAGQEVVDIRTPRALLEKDLVRLPLAVYTHAVDPETQSRAMSLFERLLELGSREADRALSDWDRR